jgi:hypothetical protein
MTGEEFKSAFSADHHNAPDVWSMILEKLNTLVVEHGGRLILENGCLNFDRTRDDDDRRNGFSVLDELYEAIPDSLKNRHRLVPCLSDYLL